VTLVGITTAGGPDVAEDVGMGRLRVVRLRRPAYDRARLLRRTLWTLRTNLALLWGARRELHWADEVLFTGSPPFLIHALVPLNLLLRRKLTYRITDFHPECLMAGLGRVPLPIRLLYRITVLLRRQVHGFEVLGEDQRRRLADIGIPAERVRLKRDPSPVEILPDTHPLPLPEELQGRAVLLYSGNFGVAHDHKTFLDAYRIYHRQGSGRTVLWLNATGAKADLVERELRAEALPVHRSRLVPLADLSRLLVAPHAHLITLRDEFVGFVLPSKVYGCLQSGRSVLFVGSASSDVHLLCEQRLGPGGYWRASVGDVEGVLAALERIGSSIR
jgi:hypothetical protein